MKITKTHIAKIVLAVCLALVGTTFLIKAIIPHANGEIEVWLNIYVEATNERCEHQQKADEAYEKYKNARSKDEKDRYKRLWEVYEELATYAALDANFSWDEWASAKEQSKTDAIISAVCILGAIGVVVWIRLSAKTLSENQQEIHE